MKSIAPLLVFLLGMAACSNNQGPKPVAEVIEDKDVISTVSKRYDGDNIFTKLLNNELAADAQLRALFEEIEKAKVEQANALVSLQSFESSNNSFYEQAASYSNSIKDSLLKKRVLALIAADRHTYDKKMQAHNNLQQSMDTLRKTLEDHKVALSVATALKGIEAYQQEATPSLQKLQEVYGYQKDLLQKVEQQTLVKVP